MKLFFLIALSLSLAFAGPKEKLEARGKQYDHIFLAAALKYSLSPDLLKSVGRTESGFVVDAVNVNSNGTIDRGIMQINSVHLTDDLTAEDLFDPEINIHVGARILRACIDRYGLTYKALNCYNGRITNNSYNIKVVANIEEGYFANMLYSRKPSNHEDVKGRIIKR